MNAPKNRRPSLRDKISGPNARPIAKLVAAGESAASRVQESFDDFVKLSIARLEKMHTALSREDTPENWNQFFSLVHDIRGSSALAGKLSISNFCASLETLLQERDPADRRMHAAILSHIGALNLAVARPTPDAAADQLLAEELERAVSSLPRKQRSFKTG